MDNLKQRSVVFFLVGSLFVTLSLLFAPSATPVALAQTIPAAVIVNDEGGAVTVSGVVTYTNSNFTLGVAAPMVILEDQAGFIDRDRGFLLPPASQTLGQITSDFYTSPFSYTIAFQIEPANCPRCRS